MKTIWKPIADDIWGNKMQFWYLETESILNTE